MRKLINKLLLRFYKPNCLEIHLTGGVITFECWGPFNCTATHNDYQKAFKSESCHYSPDLKAELRRAIASEDYEKAAEIRDKMKTT